MATEYVQVTQKSFDSISPDVDLVQRIESFMHTFPGLNIGFSQQFLDELQVPPQNIVDLGLIKFKGAFQIAK